MCVNVYKNRIYLTIYIYIYLTYITNLFPSISNYFLVLVSLSASWIYLVSPFIQNITDPLFVTAKSFSLISPLMNYYIFFKNLYI